MSDFIFKSAANVSDADECKIMFEFIHWWHEINIILFWLNTLNCP